MGDLRLLNDGESLLLLNRPLADAAAAGDVKPLTNTTAKVENRMIAVELILVIIITAALHRAGVATSHEEAVGLVGVGRNAIINSVLLVLSPAVGPDRVGAGTERIEASALGRAGEGIETGTGTGLIPLFALCRAVVAITHEEAGLIGVRGDVHVRSELLLAAPAAAAAAEGIEAEGIEASAHE